MSVVVSLDMAHRENGTLIHTRLSIIIAYNGNIPVLKV